MTTARVGVGVGVALTMSPESGEDSPPGNGYHQKETSSIQCSPSGVVEGRSSASVDAVERSVAAVSPIQGDSVSSPG
jgi:hypothetical protein